ncbi:hypothetical protein EVAR_7795_1 [Eumeta japonica]|uniref:Uncharacterized protein n=1 Tax=Eumeta variegata TaxID=151549 RepID=A0A4C1TKE3_EUMVA|nr:hypothetical protein EVAR_7795_1 [Eumeta japonica]
MLYRQSPNGVTALVTASINSPRPELGFHRRDGFRVQGRHRSKVKSILHTHRQSEKRRKKNVLIKQNYPRTTTERNSWQRSGAVTSSAIMKQIGPGRPRPRRPQSGGVLRLMIHFLHIVERH